MTRFAKRYSCLIIIAIVVIMFILCSVIYYITNTNLTARMKGTPYETYGKDWANVQRNIDMAELAKNNELDNNDLIKLSQVKRFTNIEVDRLIVRCANSNGRCEYCTDGKGIQCRNLIAIQNTSLEQGEVIVKEYTKILYYFLQEVTNDNYPPSEIIISEDSVLQLNISEHSYKETPREVAYFSTPRVIALFHNEDINLSDYIAQHIAKYFVIYYN